MPHSYNVVYIAEKPTLARTVARAIAQISGKPVQEQKGYLQVGDDVVTYFFGHMYGAAEFQEYDPAYQAWTIATLPILIPFDDWKLVPNVKSIDQLKTAIGLVKKGRVIVNCGDAGREGQLLIDEALIENGIDPFADNVKRLWTQSLTEESMRLAVEGLIPNSQKKTLYLAAVCRQRADFLHGNNLTRLYTSLARASGVNALISVGRVQTPTLWLVVTRDLARKAFKPVDHFLPKIVFEHENGKFTATWVIPAEHDGLDSEGRLVDKAVATALVDRIKGKGGSVQSYNVKKKSIAAGLPYSLSALQTECSAKFGMTAKEVLDTAQALYERHRITTYPRSDSRYLPVSILKEEAPAILASMSASDQFAHLVVNADQNRKSAAWNDAKISDHYAIIPTTEFSPAIFSKLSAAERNVFMTVAKAFIAQFYPDFEYNSISANITCEGEVFKASGRQVLEQGWKVVYGGTADAQGESGDEDEADGGNLPSMRQGDPVKSVSGDLASRRTTPPPAYTDGTLIEAMANIHLHVDDKQERQGLKEVEGIGTEATRANTIEIHLKRKYLKRKGKNGLESTAFGQSAIAVLPHDLTDPGVTARWEALLKRVETGELSPEDFLGMQEEALTAHVRANAGRTVELKGVEQVEPVEGHGEACPECAAGKMVTRVIQKGDHKGKKYLSCDQYPNCKHVAWPVQKVDPIEGHGEQCPKCSAGKLVTRMVHKAGPNKGKKFLSCDQRECGHSQWPAPKVAPVAGHGEKCPKCDTGTMLTKQIFSKAKGQTYILLGCSNYPDCSHSVFPNDKAAQNIKPLPGHGKSCPACGKGKMMSKEITSKKTGNKHQLLSCDNYPECQNSEWPDKK
ncbi:DNA topoisomerase III [Thalassospira xianhensis]|uniref:DNA topoisomerase III n=1 Tax=Thalassospira xianhensis TaxID=478503 RepID=UPI000DEDB8FC|nr:DNA topoisomerase III [Thalassospira xianhensis]